MTEPTVYGPLDDGRPNYIDRLIGQARAQAHPELKNITYPSRPVAQHMRDLVNQLADALDALKAGGEK